MKLRLTIEHLNKSYGTLPVLRDLNLSLTTPDRYCLMSPSGSGKTTLFRILMGLETADSGTVSLSQCSEGSWLPLDREQARVAAVFQEDRLIEHLSPLEQGALFCEKAMRPLLRAEFLRLLPEECLDRPVSLLSGGMRRRCALLRAILAPSRLLLLDEPFTGLDEQTKKEAARYLLERQNGRLLLLSSHSREEAALLNAVILQPPGFLSTPPGTP